MSFRNEFKDFIEGFKFAQNTYQEAARTRLLEAQTEKAQPAPYDPEGPDPFKTAPKVPETQTPKKTEVKEGPGDTITGGEGNDTLAGSTGSDTVAGPHLARRQAIQSIESGGNYQALGPMTGGDRAYGAYQVMGKNVGPWTQAALGRAMSPQEFLRDKAAQDAVFDHVFGGYVDKFGEEGAAQAWFGGPGSVGKKGGKDVLGTSVGGYGQRYLAALKKGGDSTQMAGRGPGEDTLVDTGTVDQPDDQGVIPEGDTQRSASGDDQGFVRGSPQAGVDIPAVDLPDIEYQPVPLPQLPGLGYAPGGAIPEPKRYAAGGFEEGIENLAGNMTGDLTGADWAAASKPSDIARAGFGDIRNQGMRSTAMSPLQSGLASFGMRGMNQMWGMRTPPPQAYRPNWQAIPEGGTGGIALPNGMVVGPPPPSTSTNIPQGTSTATTDTATHAIGTPVPVITPPKPKVITDPTKTVKKDTKSQLEFDKLTTPVTPAASPVAPAAPTAPKYSFDTAKLMATMPKRIAPLYSGQAMQIMEGYNKAHPNGDDPVAFMRAQDAVNKILSRGMQGIYAGGGHGRAEGGIIPEPGESFARGGSVKDPFEEEVRQAENVPRIGPAAGAGLSAHDIAARQRNIRERGVVSYAYDPTKDPSLFTKRKTKAAPGGGGKTKPAPKVKSQDMTTEEKNAERRDRELERTQSSTDGSTGGMTTEEKRAEERDRPVGITLPPAVPKDPRLDIPVPQLKAVPRETVLPEETSEAVQPVKPEAVQPLGATGKVIPETPDERILPSPTVGNVVSPKPSLRDTLAPRVPDVAPRVIGPRERVQPAQPETVQPSPPEETIIGTDAYGNPIRRGGVAEWLFGPAEYAQGGAIPDEEETGRSSTYTTSGPGPQRRNAQGYRTSALTGEMPMQDNAPAAPQQAEPEQGLSPTPEARSSIAKALDGGMRFLQDTFFRPQGAIAVPEDPAQAQQGAKRLASGEGAATKDEINQIDDQVDPQRKLDEGDRQMTRLAKVVDWYSQRGRTKEAQSAAASLMQYGAQRFSQFGSAAAAAYSQYQQSGDPKDLDESVKYLEHAYQFIPDGASFDITVDPKTHHLQGVKVDADGNETPYDLDPSELPGLIRQVQSKSPYWQQIMRMADPEGYKAGLIEKRQEAQAERVDQRQAARETAADRRQAERETAADKRAKEREDVYYKHLTAQEEKQQRQADRNYAREHPDIWPTVNPLLTTYRTAKRAADDAGANPGDPEYDAVDKAASAIWDALPPSDRRNPELMQDLGIFPDDWSYVGGTQAPAGGGPAAPPAAGGGDDLSAPASAPAAGGGLREGRTATGPNGEKLIVKNGKLVPVQ